MSEVLIETPRGLSLSGSFVNPVDSTDCAVLVSHSFLSDRHSGGHFDRLAGHYRTAGYATLAFDYSGHGLSDDDIITLDSHAEDLRAASGWLADQGFHRQLIHAHSYGATVAMNAAPPAATTMVLSGAVLGPVSYDWQAIFSSEQLDELERHGVTTIPDDSPGPRQNFTISRQTLVDLSLVDTKATVDHLTMPVLIIHDADDEEIGLVEMTEEVMPELPLGSSVQVIHGSHFGAGEDAQTLADLSLEWSRTHVPIRR